jgi:serine/threonine-protein kinase HipA
MEEVIEKVAGQLPASFSGEVAAPIFDGMREARDRLVRSRE